jgi:hypothetical protein
VNDRRAAATGRVRPEKPLSLDSPPYLDSDEDRQAISESLVADREVERDALTAVGHGDLVAKLIGVCRDPIDLAIIEAACGPSFSRRSTARDLGLTVDQVRTRIARIAARTRHPTGRVVERRDVA